VQANVDNLLHHIKGNLGVASRVSMVETVTSIFAKNKKTEHHEHHDIVKRLREMGRASEMANTILAIMVGSTAELSLSLINMVNLYLGSDNDQSVRDLSTNSGDLNGYAFEAQRLDPPFKGVYRVASEDVTVATRKFNKGDRVFLDISTTNLNSEVFPDPTVVDPGRHPKEGHLYGDGSFRYLGEALSLKIMSEVLRAVFTCKNIARAPGQSGTLKRFQDESRPDLRFAYLDEHKFACPWPTSMAVQYDAPVA